MNALFFLFQPALNIKKSSKSKIWGGKDRQILGFVESEKKNNNFTTRA